jgi:tRNA A-37 threonylcarbamoyl transferase component Bud32
VFHAIHELGVVHGDVRQQNILVKEDDSVVIIDFERSNFEDVRDMDIELEDETVEDLLVELQGHECPCSGLIELAREADGQNS